MRKIIFGALLLTAFTIQTKAQSVTAEAKAEVTSQLTISLNPGTALNFGKVAVSVGSPGTCSLSTINVATVSGGVNTIPSTTSNAILNLTGIAGSNYAISLPLNATVTRVGGSETMTVDNLKARPNSIGSDALIGTLNANTGSDSFTVGGQLNVIANQVNGIYIGTFNISVAYN